MSKKFTGTLIGAAAGFFMSGSLLGGIIGGVLGNMFDQRNGIPTRRRAAAGDSLRTDARIREFVFISNLVALMTSVAKADREIHPSEISAITGYFEQNFHYSGHDRRVIENLIREAAGRRLDLPRLCRDTRRLLEYPERLMLVRMLYMVALSDRVFKDVERERINEIAVLLNVNRTDHSHIQREFSLAAADDEYKILGVSSSASDQEIKAAYRTMVKKYHPDRVSHLGKEFADLAHEKFQRVQEAYDHIAHERHL